MRGGRIGQSGLRRLQPGRGARGCAQRELSQKPELLNWDPYGAGWLMRIELDAKAAAPALLQPGEYEQFLKESE